MHQGLFFLLCMIGIGVVSLLFGYKKIRSRTRVEIIAFSILFVVTGFSINELHDYKQLGDAFTLFEGLYFSLGRVFIVVGFLTGLIGFFSSRN